VPAGCGRVAGREDGAVTLPGRAASSVSQRGGERPFRSALPFAAWQNTPSGAGLTLRRRLGQNRSPVSRLVSRGVCRCAGRVLIADARRHRLRACFGADACHAAQTSRRSEGPFAAHRTGAAWTWRRAALSRRAALKAARRRQSEKTPRSERPRRSRGLHPSGGVARTWFFMRGCVNHPDRRDSGRGANGAAFFRAADQAARRERAVRRLTTGAPVSRLAQARGSR
jgi:hypothetical protein